MKTNFKEALSGSLGEIKFNSNTNHTIYKFIFFAIILSLFSLGKVSAQNNDCATAITICDDPITTGNPNGMGINDYGNGNNDPGCLQNESNFSGWYYFEMDANTPPNTILGFVITPAGGTGEDYDWALYGPGVGCGNLGSPVRCSSASEFCGFCPSTGLGMGAMDFSEGPGTGDGFVANIVVNAGDGFFLNINNWKGTGNGFTLDFTEAGAEFVDCAAEPPCSITASAIKDIKKCQGDDPFSLDVTVVGGTAPYTYSWSGSGNGTSFLDNPDSKSPTVTFPPDFVGTIDYTVTAGDGKCEDTDVMTVIVNPKPIVTISQPPPLCTNQKAITLVATPPGGIWGGIASTNGTIDPSQFPAGSYIASYSSTNSFGCTTKNEIDIQIVDPIAINIPPIDPLCINAIPIQIIPDPTGGTWSGEIDPDGVFDPSSYSPGNHTAIYTVISPEGCKSEEVVSIDVVGFPDVEISDPGPLCSNETEVSLSYLPLGGTWSGVVDLAGNVYPIQLGPGIFKAIYSYTSPEGCIGKDSIVIEINDPPFATLTPEITICNSTLSGKTTIIDFNQLLLTGDKNGVWTDLDNSGASGAFPNLNFDGTIPGTYSFIYTTTDAKGSCNNFSDTIQVIVEDCNCPSTAIKSPGTYCVEAANIDLKNFKITTETGTWSIQSAPPGSNPATITGTLFDGTGKDAGMYVLKFTLTTSPGGNCSDASTTQINLVAPPIAQLVSNIDVCNSLGSGQYPIEIDLFSFITSGDKSGSWVDKNISGAVGNFNKLDFAGITPGKYEFIYTTNSATAPCKEKSYSLFVTVNDCNCPILNLTNAPELCNENDMLDLSTLENNSNAGTWSIQSSPPGTKPASINLATNIFSTSKSDPGTYTLRFTLNTPQTGCPEFKDIQVKVNQSPTATVNPLAQICNSPGTGSFVTVLDFNTLISAGDKSGTWADTDGSGASGTSPNLDFTGTTPGNYNFTYTTGNAIAPCKNKSYVVSVIVKNCECPDVSIIPSLSICSDQVVLDLNSLKLTSEIGQWTVKSFPAGGKTLTINGNNLMTQDAFPGNYTLQFTLSNNPPNGCPSSSEMVLTVNKVPNTGLALAPMHLCEYSDQNVLLESLLSGQDIGGIWILNASSPKVGAAFNAATGTIKTLTLLAGTYKFDYILSGNAPCSDQQNTVTIVIDQVPVVDAGPEQTIDCHSSKVTLKPTAIAGTNLKYFWSGPGITQTNIKTQTVSKAGTYYVEAVDSLSGCKSIDSVLVLSVGNPISDVSYAAKDVACVGFDNGEIKILDVTGGTPDYQYFINNQAVANTGIIENLKAGTYNLLVKDANDCEFDLDVTIKPGQQIQANMGQDLLLLQGDNYTISLKLNIPENQINSITWTPPVCSNCLSFNAIAESNITYQVEVEDLNGCKASDAINVKVKAVRKLFIPNAFSPNGDGINDLFYVYGDAGISKIKLFRIYDRWGELIFEETNIQANDPKSAWNGKFNGKKLDNGVFVYVTEIEFTDGKSEIYTGDISIAN